MHIPLPPAAAAPSPPPRCRRRDELAELMANEMGKCIKEGRAEIEKCALVCNYYADNAAGFLAPEHIPTQASESFVTFNPLGVILIVMPWNFPFWQVFACALCLSARALGPSACVTRHCSPHTPTATSDKPQAQKVTRNNVSAGVGDHSPSHEVLFPQIVELGGSFLWPSMRPGSVVFLQPGMLF